MWERRNSKRSFLFQFQLFFHCGLTNGVVYMNVLGRCKYHRNFWWFLLLLTSLLLCSRKNNVPYQIHSLAEKCMCRISSQKQTPEDNHNDTVLLGDVKQREASSYKLLIRLLHMNWDIIPMLEIMINWATSGFKLFGWNQCFKPPHAWIQNRFNKLWENRECHTKAQWTTSKTNMFPEGLEILLIFTVWRP